MLKTPMCRERLGIFAPPPYHGGHDHDDFPPSFRCSRSAFGAAPAWNLNSSLFGIRSPSCGAGAKAGFSFSPQIGCSGCGSTGSGCQSARGLDADRRRGHAAPTNEIKTLANTCGPVGGQSSTSIHKRVNARGWAVFADERCVRFTRIKPDVNYDLARAGVSVREDRGGWGSKAGICWRLFALMICCRAQSPALRAASCDLNTYPAPSDHPIRCAQVMR